MTETNNAHKKHAPPQATIRRLSVYLRCLNGLDQDGVKVISSHDLARRLALNPAQVRKDLAYFGEFGKRGVGYSVKKLREHLVKILGLQKMRKVAIIGAGGRLGTALALYTGFEKRNFKICALFDKDPAVIGDEVDGVGRIMSIETLPRIVREIGIEILILTIPAHAIKEIHDIVMLSGVRAVLNFAPFKMLSNEDVDVHNVDLTTELEALSYRLSVRESLLMSKDELRPATEE
jgi:redox-sensing transcriptional repressor